MELFIKYKDVHGVVREQHLPMSQLSAEMQEQICKGEDENAVTRLEVVPGIKVTPVKSKIFKFL